MQRLNEHKVQVKSILSRKGSVYADRQALALELIAQTLAAIADALEERNARE